MKLTKDIIKAVIADAPKGATHLKATDAKKRFHTEAFKGAPGAFHGVEADTIHYGAVTGKGPKAEFKPLAGGPVDLARYAKLDAAPEAKAEPKAEPKSEPKADAKAEAKAEPTEAPAKVKKVTKKVAAPVKEKKVREPKAHVKSAKEARYDLYMARFKNGAWTEDDLKALEKECPDQSAEQVRSRAYWVKRWYEFFVHYGIIKP